MNEGEIKNQDDQKYSEMLESVEEIIEKISDQNCDLDTMVKNVENGYELIGRLKSRLNQTKERIEELQVKFDSSNE